MGLAVWVAKSISLLASLKKIWLMHHQPGYYEEEGDNTTEFGPLLILNGSLSVVNFQHGQPIVQAAREGGC